MPTIIEPLKNQKLLIFLLFLIFCCSDLQEVIYCYLLRCMVSSIQQQQKENNLLHSFKMMLYIFQLLLKYMRINRLTKGYAIRFFNSISSNWNPQHNIYSLFNVKVMPFMCTSQTCYYHILYSQFLYKHHKSFKLNFSKKGVEEKFQGIL